LLKNIPLSTAKISSSEILHYEVIIPIYPTNQFSFHCKTILKRNTELWSHHSYICYNPLLIPHRNYPHQIYDTVKLSFLYLLQTILFSTAKLSSSEIRHCEIIIPTFAKNHSSNQCKIILIRNTELWSHHSYICYKPSLFPLQIIVIRNTSLLNYHSYIW
jgi:hypothetical protein